MTQVQTSLRSGRRPSTVGRWLAIAAVGTSPGSPAAALGSSSDPPRGIMGPTNDGPATQIGLAERTPTELSLRVEAPSAANPDDGFSWADAGIGAGAAAALGGLAGAAYAVRRRAQEAGAVFRGRPTEIG